MRDQRPKNGKAGEVQVSVMVSHPVSSHQATASLPHHSPPPLHSSSDKKKTYDCEFGAYEAVHGPCKPWLALS